METFWYRLTRFTWKNSRKTESSSSSSGGGGGSDGGGGGGGGGGGSGSGSGSSSTSSSVYVCMWWHSEFIEKNKLTIKSPYYYRAADAGDGIFTFSVPLASGLYTHFSVGLVW